MIDFGQSCFFLSAKHSVNLQFSMGTHERRWYNLPTKYHYTEPVVCFLPSFFIWQYAKAKYVPYLLWTTSVSNFSGAHGTWSGGNIQQEWWHFSDLLVLNVFLAVGSHGFPLLTHWLGVTHRRRVTAEFAEPTELAKFPNLVEPDLLRTPQYRLQVSLARFRIFLHHMPHSSCEFPHLHLYWAFFFPGSGRSEPSMRRLKKQRLLSRRTTSEASLPGAPIKVETQVCVEVFSLIEGVIKEFHDPSPSTHCHQYRAWDSWKIHSGTP